MLRYLRRVLALGSSVYVILSSCLLLKLVDTETGKITSHSIGAPARSLEVVSVGTFSAASDDPSGPSFADGLVLLLSTWQV